MGEGVRFDGASSLPRGAEKPSTNETTNKRTRWASLRHREIFVDGFAVKSRFGVGEGVRFDGASSLPGGAEKPSTNETTNKRTDNGARVEGRFGVGDGVRFDRASSLPAAQCRRAAGKPS